MAMTGIKGTDLYYLNEERGVWEYVNTARPQEKNFKADSIQSKVYVEHLDGEMHEYMLYLPLYDGVNWVQIGVDSTAQLIQPQVENPRKMGKIVLFHPRDCSAFHFWKEWNEQINTIRKGYACHSEKDISNNSKRAVF
jgi:hypothetical protein